MMSEKHCVNIEGIGNPIDVLFDSYFDSRGHDDARLEDAYERFCHTLVEVDPFQIEEIMGAAADLCMEHERAGFVAGIKTYACLMREISG